MKSIISRKGLIALTVILGCLATQTTSQLAFVIELYRHGARGPYYPNTWNSNQQTYQMQQLVPAGMREHYILGQQMRQQYIQQLNFLSSSYNWTQIYIRSTDVNRTLMSAQSHLYGMYPPGTGPFLPSNLSDFYQIPPYTPAQPIDIGLNALPNAFQPFPINTVNNSDDPLLNPYPICPRFNELLTQTYAQHANTLQYINAQFSQTNQLLGQMLNRSDVNISIYEPIFDVFVSDMYQALPLPAGLTQEVWNNVTFFDSFSWFFNYSSLQERRLLPTPLFQYWVDNLDIVAEGQTNYPSKWIMLSGHDSNLAQVITSLNFSSWQCQYDLWFQGQTDALNCVYRPYYAASIILELYQNDVVPQDWYVMIQYDGVYMNLCQQKSQTCSYKQFSSRIKNWIVQDFNSQCQAKKNNLNGQQEEQNLIALALQTVENKQNYDTFLDFVLVQIAVLVILVVALIIKKQFVQSNLAQYSRVSLETQNIEDSNQKSGACVYI